ncbi:MAG TPA: 4'-phosphopantetheinyl transferase superfamily protein [Candidatus Elarobacter sp.]|nr:4'-phosphopantetheinyl transferase superfamily protein [Candidatus Elarobacter sp.]
MRPSPGQGRRDEVAEAIGRTLPSGIVFAGGTIDGGQGALFDEEAAAVARAVPKRYREFAAGRTYARIALARLGVPPAPIPVRPDRAPRWPQGAVGSISHCAAYCGVLAARAEEYAGIGLDVELAEPLPADLVALVCSNAELDVRAELESRLGADLPKLLFVVKECAYKAYAAATGSFLDFADLEVAIDADERRFTARLVREDRPAAAGRRTFSGSFLSVAGLVVAWSALPLPTATGDG